MSLFQDFLKGLSLLFEARIWIRILIRVISRIRIRIKVMRVHNTAVKFKSCRYTVKRTQMFRILAESGFSFLKQYEYL